MLNTFIGLNHIWTPYVNKEIITPEKSKLQGKLLMLLENGPSTCRKLAKSFPDVKYSTVSWNLATLIRNGQIKATSGRDRIYGLLRHRLPDKKNLAEEILKLLRIRPMLLKQVRHELPEYYEYTNIKNTLYGLRGKREGYATKVNLSDSGYYIIRNEYR